MATDRGAAVVMALVLLLTPIAGATGSAVAAPSSALDGPDVTAQADSEISGNFINTTDSVDIWDRSVLPLRVDRSDSVGTATSVENMDIIVESSAGSDFLRDADNNNLVVYRDNTTLDLGFDAGRAAAGPDLEGTSVHLIAAKAESAEDPELPSTGNVDALRTFIQEESDNEDIVFENVTTTQVSDETADFQYDLSQESRGAGSYVFMAVQTQSGSGITVENQNISVDGESNILGVDTALVQQTASDVSVDDEYEVGETIEFTAESNLVTEEDRVEHVVALWNESAVADEELTIIAPDDISSDTTTGDFTVNHSIAKVSGVQNASDDVSAFGRTLSSNQRAGVFDLADVVTFLANDGEFSQPETNRVGDTVINASMTSVNTTSPNTTIEVETREDFEPGEYVAVHMAMADGQLTKISSDREDITLTEQGSQPAFGVNISDDVDPTAAQGDDVEIPVTIENTGAAGTDEVTLSAGGETLASRNVDLDANETTLEVFSVPTGDLELGETTFTVASDENTDTVPVDIQEPSDFGVSVALAGPSQGDQYDPRTDSLNGTVTVTNNGDVTDEQNVSVTFGDETLVDQAVSLAGSESTTVEFNRTLTAADAGDIPVTATTDDDIATQTISILQPGTFEVDVIDDESELSVVPGQDITVIAEVENVGETEVTRTVNLTNITADASEVTTEEFTLEAGESQDFEATVGTTEADASSSRTYAVAAEADDTDTVTAEVGDISPYLDVTIDDINQSSVDEPGDDDTVPVQVNTTVENLGTEETTGDVTFTANGEEFATQTFDSSTGSQPFNVTYDVELGDAPEVAIEVTAERDSADEPDSSDVESLDVTPQAEFAISIDQASNVSDLSTEEFAPEISVENVGEQNESATVEVFFNGSSKDTFVVDTLDTGSERTIVSENEGFSINASDFDSGQSYLVEAEVTNDATSETDADTDRVAIGQPANFSVNAINVPTSVNQGETIDIETTIENTGGVNGTKPVTFEFGDTTLETNDIEIASGSTTTETISYTATSSVAGSTSDASVSTPDDEATESVTVRENAEFTADLVVDENAIAGDTVTAAVTARNVGGLANNETDIRLLADGQEVANTTNIQLSSGEQRTETYELSPETAGELEVQGVTDDSVATRTLTVGEPGALELNIRSVTDPVTTTENVTATVSAENIGDGDLEDRRVRITLDGSVVATERVSLDSGEQQTIDFTTDENQALGAGNATVAAVAPEDRVEREIAIVEPADPPYFRVDGLEASSEEVLNTDSETVTVNATITNVGETEGTQNITFSAGDAVTAANDSLTVASGSAKDVSFEFDVSELGLDLATDESANVSYDIETANQSEAGTLTVTEPQPATPAFTAVSVPDSATQNDDLTVSATVRNIGDQPLDANESVTLAYDGGTASDAVALNSSADVSDTLAPGAEATVEISVTPPPEPLAGSFTRDVTTDFENYSSPVTETVSVDFEGVASGVDAADSGDTVIVRAGDYTARNTIEIPAGVTVQAASSTTAPVLHEPSRSDETAVRAVGDGVTLDGLTFTGDGNGTAVEVASDATTLTDIRAQNWDTGIDETAGTSTLAGLDVVNTDVGIRLAGVGETTVEYPRVINAADTGILVESDANEIIGGEVLRSATGIELLGEDNEVRDTTVRNSPGYGIRVTEVPGNLGNGNPSAVIDGSVLESNGVSVFSDGSEVNATGNWWGTPKPVENVDYTARSELAAGDPLDTRPESEFTVANSTLPSDVARGSTFTVEPTIENDGTTSDLQQIELRRGDGTVVDSQSLSLDSGASGTVSLSDSTDVSDGESISLTVASLDNTSTTNNIAVNDPAEFALGDVSAPRTTVALGETVSVDAPVDNVGDSPGTVTAELRDFDGNVVDTADVDVGASDTETPTLSWDTDVEASDDVTVALVDDSGSDLVEETLAVTVGPAAPTTLSVSVDEVSDNTLTVDETAAVSATAGLTDDSNVDATASTTFSSDNTTVATVSENTITAEAVGTATIEGTYTDEGETVRNTVDVTVEAAADEGDDTDDETPTSGGGGGGGGFFGSTPADSLSLDATASQTVRATLDTTTNQRVATFDEVSNVESITFDTTDQITEVTVSDVDPDTSEVNAPGGAVTVQEIVVPDDMTEQSASIRFRVSSERLGAVGASADDLVAVRLTDDGWEALESTSVDETDDGVEIEATTPGFSVFAVSAVGQPEAAATATPSTVTAGETLELDGADSTDQFGELVSYDWSIDGQSLSGETTSVTLDESGEYTAELTVTNDAGETDTATTTVTVEQVADGGDGGADDGDGGADDGDDTDTSEDGIPGFGVIIALLAVIAAALLASRRTDQ